MSELRKLMKLVTDRETNEDWLVIGMESCTDTGAKDTFSANNVRITDVTLRSFAGHRTLYLTNEEFEKRFRVVS